MSNSFTCTSFAPVKKGEIKSPKKLIVFYNDILKNNAENKLKDWLDKKDVKYTESLPERENNDNLVILSTVERPTKNELDMHRDIFRRVQQGATLVMLNPPLKSSQYRLANPPKVDSITTDNPFYRVFLKIYNPM